MSWKSITFTIFLVLIIIFTVQNHILIDIKFITWEIPGIPLVVVLLFGLIFGFLTAMMMELPRIIKLKRELKRVVQELEASEKIVADNDEDVNSEGVSMGSDYNGGFFNEK
ncbi:MAG: LapA family protein [Prolixibacteraceae bacterium]